MSVLTDLRELARHIDPQFHFSLNELPAVVSALVVKLEQGEELVKAIEDGQRRQQELHPAEIAGNEVSSSVAHLIEPPQEGADQPQGGVSQARYNALASEVDQLRDQLNRLAGHIPPNAEPAAQGSLADVPPEPAAEPPGLSRVEAPPEPAAEPPAAVPSSREQELQAEVDQLRAEAEQRAAIARATGEHPVAVQPSADAPAPPPVTEDQT